MSSQAASREGRCGGEVFHTDGHPGETGKTQAPVGQTLGQGVAGRNLQREVWAHPGYIPVGSQMSMGARDKRPESLLGKEQREGSQAMRSVPERAFPAWTRATAADVWGWWETSREPWESPSLLLQESPEETPRKRRRRSARARAAAWALPPVGAAEECRGPHGSPRCLRPSSGETLPKRQRRCARGPAAAASEAAAVAGWAPPPTGPSERGGEPRSWGRRGAR